MPVRDERGAFGRDGHRGHSIQQRRQGHEPGGGLASRAFDRVQRDPIGCGEAAGARAPQALEVCATPQPLPEVVRQRSDVEPGAGHQTQADQHRIVAGQPLELADMNFNSFERDRRLPAREPVRARPLHFLGGVGRRHLHERAAERFEGAIEVFRLKPEATNWISIFRLRAEVQPFGIVRRRRDSQPHICDVLLLIAGEELRKARRTPDEQDEHAGRERIERAGVADALLSERASRARDDVVRRRP